MTQTSEHSYTYRPADQHEEEDKAGRHPLELVVDGEVGIEVQNLEVERGKRGGMGEEGHSELIQGVRLSTSSSFWKSYGWGISVVVAMSVCVFVCLSPRCYFLLETDWDCDV